MDKIKQVLGSIAKAIKLACAFTRQLFRFIMSNEKTKQAFIYLVTILASILFIVLGSIICKPDIFNESSELYYKARVVEVVGTQEEEYSLDGGETMVSNKRITFKAKFTSGPYKGDVVEVAQDIDNMYAHQPREVRKGDNILVSRPNYEIQEGDAEWIFIEHNRIGKIVVLVAIFLLMIVMVGRKKGLSTIISLIFTVLAIFLVYIPSILKGYNVYVMTIIISVFAIFMSLIIINGWNIKTFCAIFGNCMGVAAAGILAVIVSRVLELTGMIDEDYILLTMFEPPINLRAVVWGGVVIGALGAIMDVAMSIASAMNELNQEMHQKTFNKMLRSGMNIGRDAIGTMTNTLILAYIGGALATVLLLVAYNKNIYFLFNMEMIMAEIVSAIVGSIGILAAVPATAFFAAYVFNRDEPEDD